MLETDLTLFVEFSTCGFWFVPKLLVCRGFDVLEVSSNFEVSVQCLSVQKFLCSKFRRC